MEKGTIELPDGGRIPYVKIGAGSQRVVVLPGAGDGLTTVVQGAGRLDWFYARRKRDFSILVLSRRDPIPEGWSMAQHAEDMFFALDRLNWGPTLLECNSAGGPVGQQMAVLRPTDVLGLILSCTLHRTAAATRDVLEKWIGMCRRGQWREMNWSSIEYTFRPQSVKMYRLARPLLALMGAPRDPERLPRILEALLPLDQRALLPEIRCPTLVIGGEEDRVVPAEVQREMAALIPGAELKLYRGYGHGNDQENPDYELQVRRFAERIKIR